MDDRQLKLRYQKYKLQVKVWEKDFKKKWGRVPSKPDIQDASQSIRYAYKMYYKLKTSFLEDTLNDVLSEDGYDVLELSQIDDSNDNTTCNGGPQLPTDMAALLAQASAGSGFSNLNELPNKNALHSVTNLYEGHVLKNFEAVKILDSNEQAWGNNVSKPTKNSGEIAERAGVARELQRRKSNLTKQVFNSSSFSIRNPRKSLSRSSSFMSESSDRCTDSQHTQEVLPDLEYILNEKAREQQEAHAIAANPYLADHKTKESLPTSQIDMAWLERTTADSKTDETTETKFSLKKTQTADKKPAYGLANINVSKLVPTMPAGPPSKDISKLVPVYVHATSASIDVTKSDAPREMYNKEVIADDFSKKTTSMNTQPRSCKQFSDSAVSDSEGEEEYCHITKRRKTLPDADTTHASVSRLLTAGTTKTMHSIANKIDEKLQLTETVGHKPISDIDARPKRGRRKTDLTPKNVQLTVEIDNGADFSADDEKDADFIVEKPKRGRKKAEKKPVSPKPKAKPKAKPKTVKNPEKAKTKVSKALAKTQKTKETEEAPTEEDQAENKPPDIQNLKYALALDSGKLTSLPRINLAELERAECSVIQYINGTNPTTQVKPVVPVAGPINAKREAARRKLEEKMAAGKLNENFVSINIQKKKYSRGKKTFNFSKYKKTQWKHRKRVAALTGPDMDMGGCDGGVLTCFTCGQVGHFASNCNIKGDALLPLTAQLEEDPSPFPTLEEVEKMATQSAVAVHSRNLAKLPHAPNTAIYQKELTVGSEIGDMDCATAAATVEKFSEEIEAEDMKTEELQKNTHTVEDAFLMETDEGLETMDLNAENLSPIKKFVGHQIPKDFLIKAGLDAEHNTASASAFSAVGALYDLNADGTVKDVTPEVLEALHLFGHPDFRKGQDRAVMRILSGLSTLVTLSTGSGKSLCYQLPAYLYSRQKKSITLVVSPLVSLMEDQVTGVPHFLRAQCLHTNQTPAQRLKTMQLIADGEIDILLVSPEAVVAGERSSGFGAILRQLPPIAFACIDEAHCVSQWSHNFRPSYLMICKVLRKNLGVKTVLGLTATATLTTRQSIIAHLGIADGEQGVISDTPLPANLVLSVSKDENRDNALLTLLTSERFDSCQSIIVYCTRRNECERIAAFLRTCMQDRKSSVADNGTKKRKRLNWHAEPYHAGMPASRRRTIQNAFMRNELRIVVATVAFGMGINKPDIRAIIHYNMPRNFESYVQEVGRAGRDGKLSHCHLFLDSQGGDQYELRRHIYANSIDRHVIRKLLQRIFVPCSCVKRTQPTKLSDERTCPGHEIGFPIEQTVESLDIQEENISTLLCYMELDQKWRLNVLSSAYIMAKIISYGGPKYLKHAAKECPPLAMAIALKIKDNSFKEDTNIIEFSVVDIAAAIGWNSGVVKYQLKNLEWIQVNGFPKRSPLNVNFYSLGLRVMAPGDFTDDEIDEALDFLHSRAVQQEKTQLIQLQYVYKGLSSVAYKSYVPCSKEDFSHDRSDQLKGIIRNYFSYDYPKEMMLDSDASTVPDDYIIADIHGLVNMYPENQFTGRNIARIFSGISSPNFPAVIWGRCKYWRTHLKTDFNHIVQLANTIVIQRR